MEMKGIHWTLAITMGEPVAVASDRHHRHHRTG